MDNLTSPIPSEVETVTSVDTITPGFSPPAVPIMALPIDFPAYSYGNPCGFELSAPVYNNVAIASYYPNRPTIPSTSTTSKTIIMWKESSRK